MPDLSKLKAQAFGELKSPDPSKFECPDEAEACAIKALFDCTAEEHQQKIAMDWIINKLCRTFDPPFHKDQRETDLALGKKFVGDQLMIINNEPITTFKRTTP